MNLRKIIRIQEEPSQRRHGIFDREGQAKYINKLSKKDLEEQNHAQTNLNQSEHGQEEHGQEEPEFLNAEPIHYEIPFQCDICHQMFDSQDDLDRHKVF